MQFFYKRCQVFIDYSGQYAPCSELGFEQLTSFKPANMDWRTYALEGLGMVLMGIIEKTMIIMIDRKSFTKKQAYALLANIQKQTNVHHFFVIENHGLYKIHDVDNREGITQLIRYIFNSKNEQEYTSQPLAYMDDGIVESDPIIAANMEIFKYFKGFLSIGALQAIERNKILSGACSIVNEDFKFTHFGINLALNMGDGHLFQKMKGNDLRNVEFKEYVRERTRYLAPAFNAEQPFFQHVDTTLNYGPHAAMLRYKIGIFPWKNLHGKYLQMVSNNYGYQHYFNE